MSVRKPWEHQQPQYTYRGRRYGSNREAAVKDWARDGGDGTITVDYGHGPIDITPQQTKQEATK